MKRIISFVLIFIFSLGLFSCKDENFTGVTFVDHAGRTVAISEPAKRIVSGYYSSTTLCLTLGLKDNLVAIEQKADTRNLYKQAAPELLELPGVSTKKGINFEETLNCNPDLVILPLTLKDEAKKFEDVGINVIVVNPETRESIKEAISFIGMATGTLQKANDYTDFNDELIYEINSKTSKITDLPKVYISSTSNYLNTFSKGYLQHKLISIAGGISVSKEVVGDEVSPEQLLEWNPEYFFYVADATYSNENILADSKINSLECLEKNLYQVPSKLENWDANNSSYALGALWMAATLHPDLFTLEYVFEKAQEFYLKFYDLEINREMLEF